MTDPQSSIRESLGNFTPVFELYSSFLYEKIRYDSSELFLRGKNDRSSFFNAEDGFKSYIVQRERSSKNIMLNNAICSIFPFLSLMLKNETELLSSFERSLLHEAKRLENEAYDVYAKAFYDDA